MNSEFPNIFPRIFWHSAFFLACLCNYVDLIGMMSEKHILVGYHTFLGTWIRFRHWLCPEVASSPPSEQEFWPVFAPVTSPDLICQGNSNSRLSVAVMQVSAMITSRIHSTLTTIVQASIKSMIFNFPISDMLTRVARFKPRGRILGILGLE